MHANEPEMAKKWEKEEAIKGKLRNLIKQEIKSINEMPNFDRGTSGLPRGFIDDYNKIVKKLSKGKGYGTLSRSDKKKVWATLGKIYNESVNESVILEWNKYHLGGLLDSKLKKRLERTIRVIGGKVDSVGMDYITFRIGGMDLRRLPSVIKKLDRNKNVWIGDKQKNNIWDRKRNIDKLHKEAFRPKGVSLMKKIVFLPKSKLYFDPDNGNFWLMGPYGGEPDWEEDPIEPKDRDYKRTLSRLSSKDKSIMKKSLRGKGNWKEATTSVSVPGYLTPNAFKKSTQKAIDVDDEDDEKNESINEVRWPDNQTSRLLAQAFKDAKVKVQKVWEKGNHEYIIRVRAKDGWTNVKMELNVVSNVITLDTQGGHVRLGELQPGSRGRKLTKNLKMLSKLPSFGVAGFKGLKYKIESINERKLSSHQKKAILIAIEMSGNMTGAVKKIERIKRGLSNDKKVKDALRLANESMAAPFRRRNSRGLGRVMKVGLNESDLGLTYKKGKTVKVTHKKSGKSLIIIDKPNVKREYEKIGYFAEGTVNELQMAPFSSQEARLHIDADIKKMSKELGKASHDIIKMMMDGVKRGRYTAMDISRGIKEGPAKRTHFGELQFIQQLWNKVRDKFRRYSKDRKLS